MAISKRLRFEIYKRDGHTCQYCGAPAPKVELQIDHIVPTSLGGEDKPSNLITACRECNSGKSSSMASDASVPAADISALRWAKAVEQVAGDRRRYRDAEKLAHDSFLAGWPFQTIPDDWKRSITNFVRMGLVADDLLHYLEQAYERTQGMDWCWKYFCKVCWSEVRSIRERAAAILDDVPEPEPEEQVCPLLEAMSTGWPESFTQGFSTPPWFEPDYDEIAKPCVECDARPQFREGLCETCLRRQYDNYDGAL